MKLTSQQSAFVSAVVSGSDNIALVARAGSGKTSTIMAAVNALATSKPTAEIAICAYNKAIANEISEKLKKAGHTDWRKIQGTTIHSLGYSLIKFVFRSEIDDKKVIKLADPERFTGDNRALLEQYSSQVVSLVRYAKQAGVGFFDDAPIASVDVWHRLAEHFDVNGVDDAVHMEEIVRMAQHIYRMSLNDTGTIDFDDMILFPLIKNLRVKFGKDFIFLDEAQDLSRTRQALARKFLKPTGRMFIIGDDRQAIYGFSGADAEALDRMTSSINAIKMPLSVTFRCPINVVKLAQTIVPDITWAEGAAEGEVLEVDEMPSDITADDAILCRNTAPLITLAYGFIRQGKAAKVEGRSIGENLDKLCNRWKVTTIASFLDKLETYRDREVQKAAAKGNDTKIEEVNDRCDCLREICNACLANNRTDLQAVRDMIASLFADDVKGAITLCTYHRSKGREWGRVVLFEHKTRCPSKAARQAWQRLQEDNLAYVAFTRAMKTLVFVG